MIKLNKINEETVPRKTKTQFISNKYIVTQNFTKPSYQYPNMKRKLRAERKLT